MTLYGSLAAIVHSEATMLDDSPLAAWQQDPAGCAVISALRNVDEQFFCVLISGLAPFVYGEVVVQHPHENWWDVMAPSTQSSERHDTGKLILGHDRLSCKTCRLLLPIASQYQKHESKALPGIDHVL